MIGAFFYLTICSIRNRVRVRLKRLRQPRYVAGLIVGGLYLYRVAFRNLFRASRSGRPPSSTAARPSSPSASSGSTSVRPRAGSAVAVE